MSRNNIAITVKWLIILLPVHEVLASNISLNTGCPDGFSWLSSVHLGECWLNILRQATIVSFRIFLFHFITCSSLNIKYTAGPRYSADLHTLYRGFDQVPHLVKFSLKCFVHSMDRIATFLAGTEVKSIIPL
jgi:hypothetical protein